MNRMKPFLAVLAVALLVSALPAAAQRATGDLYVEVKDTEGNALPGATVEVSGMGATRVEISNAQGQVRFIGIDPGTVQMKASLDGFSTVDYPTVVIRANYGTSLEVSLSAAIEEVITVTSESPLLDEKKVQQGTTITQVELEKIPTARDPWAVLSQTPGVMVDRINVGGNQSGQQSNFHSPGTSDNENAFLVDGVEITDMAAIGASPTYYDFDQFSEMQFGTGGADVSKSAPGVSVNLITKRGTNEFRGSARFLVTDGNGLLFAKQSTPDVSQGDLAPTQASFIGNKINKIEEWGFEAGGPLFRDKIWLWASHGQNDIKNLDGAGNKDDTILTNTAFKVNAQVTGSNSAIGQWNNGDKEKFGRNASPTRPPLTTYNQRGPTALIKFEDTHVFNSDFFLTGTYSKVDGGFSLTSIGVVNNGCCGPDQAGMAILGTDGVWRNSFRGGPATRPSDEYKVEGSYFFNTGNVNHELKFGARSREFSTVSPFEWAQGDTWAIDLSGNLQPALLIAKRGIFPPISQEYTSYWVQDTLSSGNWTVNAGLRFDDQSGNNEAFTVEANPIFPNDLPSLNYGGGKPEYGSWESISPRIGVTYALGEERKTLLRGSYSQFPSQLGSGEVSAINPAGISYATYIWYDNDGSENVTAGDDTFLIGTSGFDPANPLASANRYDPGLDPSTTSELLFGVEHAFLPEFVVGATITVRNTTDIQENRRLIRDASGNVRPAEFCGGACDWVPDGVHTGTLPNGQSYSSQRWALNATRTGGFLTTNGDRERDYFGYGVNFTKRLANQWMLRGYVQLGEAEWDIGPDYVRFSDPNAAEIGSDIDGGVYGIQSGGSGAFTDVIVQTSWQFNVNGMYQVAPDRPWGFNVAANIFGREGYPLPYYEDNEVGSDGISRDVRVVGQIDDFRADDVLTVDLRLEKEFAASGDVGFTFSIDAFNLFNEAYVLQRDRRLDVGRADWVTETLSPRIWRLGVRINWR